MMRFYTREARDVSPSLLHFHMKSCSLNRCTPSSVRSQSPMSSPSDLAVSSEFRLSQVDRTDVRRAGMQLAIFAHFSSAPRSGKRKILRPIRQRMVSSRRLFRPPVASHTASGKNILAMMAVFSLSTIATGLLFPVSRCSPKRHCFR